MRIPIFAIVVATIPLAAHATTTFEPEQRIFSPNAPTSVTAADLDGDLDIDLVLSGSVGTEIYENTDGNGTLVARPVDSLRATVYAVDLDGDADADIVGFSPTTDQIVWYRNDGGPANFSAAIPLTAATLDSHFAPIDLDGDGDLDLAWMRTFGTPRFEYILNTGTGGTFAAVASFVLPSGPQYFTSLFDDITGDGIPDLLTRSSSSEILSLTGSTSGGYALAAPTTLLAGGPWFFGAVGKIDGDADNDLLVSNGSSEYFWYANNGTGSFSNPRAAGDDFAQEATIVDGHILYRLGFVEPAHWLRNTDGTGTFGTPVAALASTDAFQDLVAADLDDNGLLDIVGVESTGASLALQTATDTFATQPPLIANPDTLTALASADLEGDGNADILVGAENGEVFVVPGTGGGNFAPPARVASGLGDLTDLVAVDLDSQNGPDLLSMDTNGDRVRWNARNADGSFAAAATIDTGDAPQDLTTGDFDGDGTTEFAVCYGADDRVSVFAYNAGSNTFTKTNLGGTIDGATAIASGDLDGDDDLDIVSGSLNNGTVYKFTNNGSGSFSAATSIATTPSGIAHIKIADIDGQNGNDIFVVENSGTRTTVTLLFNDGAGNFPTSATALTTDERAQYSGFDVADLDDDGDPDFTVAHSNDRFVAWYENDGAGAFTRTLFSTPANTRENRTVIVDLDADGDLDVTTIARLTRRIAWYENALPSTDPIVLWAQGKSVPAAEIADLLSDGDGDGFTLLEEFAFNLDPLSGIGASAATLDPDSATATLTRRRDAVAIGLTYTFETSPDLVTWTEQVLTPGSVIDADYEFASFTESPAPGRFFLRVHLEYAE